MVLAGKSQPSRMGSQFMCVAHIGSLVISTKRRGDGWGGNGNGLASVDGWNGATARGGR